MSIEPTDPQHRSGEKINRATGEDKLALGLGAAAALGVAAGIFIARKTGEARRKFTIKGGSELIEEYWQLDYVRDSIQQTRYFHGSEAAVHRRIKQLNCEVKELKRLDRSRAEYLVMEQKTHIIEV